MHFRGPEISSASVRDLLAMHASVLNELHGRKIIRTRNAPLGEVAESIALVAYGGSLPSTPTKSYGLLTSDGKRVQVKARLVAPDDRSSQSFSAFRSWDFDVALFLLFDASTYDLVWARELGRAEARALGYRSEHTNSTNILRRHVAKNGRDVTSLMSSAYERLDALAQVSLQGKGAGGGR